METLLPVLGWVGSIAFSVALSMLGLAKWVVPKVVDKRFQQELEAYRAQLNRELEDHKSRIRDRESARQRLHDHQFTVIQELHKRLVRTAEPSQTILNRLRPMKWHWGQPSAGS